MISKRSCALFLVASCSPGDAFQPIPSLKTFQQRSKFCPAPKPVLQTPYGSPSALFPQHYHNRLSWHNEKGQKIFSRIQKMKRRVLTAAVSLLLVFSLSIGAMASSGGRTGGSFGSVGQSSPTPQTSSGRSSSVYPTYRYSYSNPSAWSTWMSKHHNHRSNFGFMPRVKKAKKPSKVVRILSTAGAIILTGAGGLLMAYGFASVQEDGVSGPLGSGATATSVTVSLNVPNRDDPDCILKRLKCLADRSDTSRREGIQDLLQEAALELLRNEDLIKSASVQSAHYRDAARARKDFTARSVESRAKYGREVTGDQSSYAVTPTSKNNSNLSSTLALVTLHLAIDGDSTRIPPIKNRSDLIAALRRIAEDAKVEDNLFAAEVIWQPGERDDVLTQKEIYSRYPNLMIV